MPKSLFVDPSETRAPGKISFDKIPVNAYKKTIAEERKKFALLHIHIDVVQRFKIAEFDDDILKFNHRTEDSLLLIPITAGIACKIMKM